MTAKTGWWFCGKCGFQNHPRANQDPMKCEQCGHNAAADHKVVGEVEAAFLANDVDYTPRGV